MVDTRAIAYDYSGDPLNNNNRHVAKEKGWIFDPDWHDHVDTEGHLVHGPYHMRPTKALDPAALK
jgi:hypothetical protein